MNKKKSKALAFLLAASLLIPSTNGIVSASEINRNTSSTYSEAVTESKIMVGDKEFNNLADAVKNAKETNEIVKISGTINLDTSKSAININGVTIQGENNAKIVGTNMFSTNDDSKSAKFENIEFVNNSKDGWVIYQNNASLEVIGCRFVPATNENYVGNLIMIEGRSDKSKLVFEDNTVEINCRVCIPGIPNNSIIKNNTIDLLNEKYQGDASQRTSMLSITANENSDDIEITGNTFKNANRSIAVDKSSMNGENLIIKNNKFIETRFAFEVGSKDKDNIGKSYDLSGNYFEHSEAGKGIALKIQDADSDGSNKFTYEDGTTELNMEKDTPLDLTVGPYYKTDQLDKNDMVHTGVATMDGVDYPTFEQAIKAANSKEGVQTIEFRKNIKIEKIITLEDVNIIGKDKKVVIDLVEYFRVGKNVKIENVELRANKDGMVMIHNNAYANLIIDNCKITAADGVEKVWNVVTDGAETVSLKLLNSEILVNARNSFPSVGSGSVIKNNVFDLKGEKYGDTGSRTSIISIVGTEDGSVEISGNTFKNANRGIAVDNSPMKGENIKIKDNIFKNVRFGFELDPTKEINQNKNYDLSRNYFEFNGQVGRMRIQDASSNENKFDYGQNSAELDMDKFGENGEDSSISLWPFYTDPELNHLSNEPSIPSKPINPTYDHTSIIGSDRYETAGKIADKLGSYDTAVLVNATSTMSDGLSAAGLAGKEDASILLVKKDSIPKATMDRLSKVKKVYIIGGENAISQKVVNQLNKNNVKVNIERLGGKTRVETSELVAKKIGSYKKTFIVNGFKGEADAMSASSVAAREEAPILLTNGKSSSTDRKSGVSYYVVGGKSVMNDSIVKKYKAERISGDDRYETNREMINEFYGASETLYFANGETLVDALTASTIAKDDGLVLVGRKSDNKILNKKNTIQVGGMKFDVDFEK